MPPRWVVGGIVLAWSVTTALFVSEDVWPRLFPAGPPFRVDIDVELSSQLPPVRWQVIYRQQPIGDLYSGIEYHKEDDTFELYSRFRYLKLDYSISSAQVSILIENWSTRQRISRDGQLRAIFSEGKATLSAGTKDLQGSLSALGKVEGRVREGKLWASCVLDSSLGRWSQEFDPVAVRQGEVLHPLLPLDRITGLKPGGRPWNVTLDDTLDTLVQTSFQKLAAEYPLFRLLLSRPSKPRQLIARTLPQYQNTTWREQDIACVVIEYKNEQDELVARTWVHADDGRVLRQQAFLSGESIELLRSN